ncbi:uncharacterized protein B0H18DRAFT_954320 [Fomitopsis serialis]|uniref:uncharacterized protein n=1 Tax=Fomitopsis serialis TaxID=139415 RepID=UPI002008D234|nr:uncharacterized protein B0H18DRAFT_954320 [Neoantrodia serialis]KAH9927615.1 hypothetical protein B0H18DRAFT_954320 [Neoantrodia serialis]
MSISPSYKQLYNEQGFVVIPNLIPEASFKELKDAAERAIARTRSGEWKLRRTVGSQFPPYDPDSPDAWGVQHIMHPDMNEPAFAKWYTSDPLVEAAEGLLGCTEGELQMELFNMLINPESHAFALRWHRDDVREKATEDEERQALSIWHHGVQWNTFMPLRRPRSHQIPRTPEQRARSITQDPPENPLDMPGALQVTLKPGETVFYNNNILHCATYDPYQKRATLHACMGDTRGGAIRARNILQHGLFWMKEPPFRDTLNERGKKMLERLLKLQESVNGDLGYSQVN